MRISKQFLLNEEYNNSKNYYTIIFLQNEEDYLEFEKILKQNGEHEAMEYLKQWDYGTESLIDGTSDEPWGRNDEIYKEGDYVMNYNTGVGYAGLVFVEGGAVNEQKIVPKKPKINEAVSEKSKNTIDKWISQFGERETGVKIIDSWLRRRLGGLESSDLPDTATFASGLDDIEEFLRAGDYQGAIDSSH